MPSKRATKATAAADVESTPFQKDNALVAKITRRLTGQAETKSSTLPFADASTGARIEQANNLRKQISGLEEELKKIKTDLTAEVVGLDVPGLRTAEACIIVNCRTRTSLDKDKLLQKLTAEEIAECYTESDGYYEARLQDVK